MSTDALLNQSEPNVILTAHATKVNRTEPNWTEQQTCLACQNHALKRTFTSIWWLWIRMYNIRCYFFPESYWWRVDCILNFSQKLASHVNYILSNEE